MKLVGPLPPAKRVWFPAILLCVTASMPFSTIAYAGAARDYLNAPIDAWLITYNAGYLTSVTPEDGTDISSRTPSNVFLQSLVLTPTMDFCGRTGGLTILLPSPFPHTLPHTTHAH